MAITLARIEGYASDRVMDSVKLGLVTIICAIGYLSGREYFRFTHTTPVFLTAMCFVILYHVTELTEEFGAFGSVPLFGEVTLAKRAFETILLIGSVCFFLGGNHLSVSAINEARQQLESNVQLLNEREDKLQAVLRCTADFIWEVDLQTGALRRLGDSEDALSHQAEQLPETMDAWEELLHPDERGAYREALERSIQGGDDFRGQYRLRRPDGTYGHWEIRGTGTQFDEAGRPSQAVGASTDITHRRQMEERIRESEQRYRSLVENLPTVCWESDEHGHTSFVSPNIEQVYGYRPQEIYDRGEDLWFGRIHPEDREKVRHAFDRLVRDGHPLDVEYRMQRKDGCWIWLQDRSGYMYEKEGVRYACGAFLDITERKRTEEALRESERQFRTLVENIPGVVYRCKNDADWTMLFVSDSVCDISGYPASQFVNDSVRTFASIIYPDDREMVWRSVQEGLQSATPYALEYRIVHSDGDVRWVYERGRGVVGEDGQVGYLDGALFDITDRKQAQEALEESERRYRALYENANDAIFLMRDDRIIECNPRAMEMYRCTREQIVGMTPVDLSPAQQPDGRLSDQKAHDLIEQALGGEAQRFEWRHARLDGTPFDAEVSLSCLDLVGQKLLLALVRDESERQRAQKKLMEYQSGLRSLASELSLAEERERRRVASYLHDGPCQQLASSLMKLEALRVSAGAGRSEDLKEVCRQIDETVGDLRDLTFDLSPPTLYMLGLEAAIEELLKEVLRDKHGIAYEFRRGGLSRPLGDDLRVLLFQSVRELVTNIVKYASARKVTVSIKSEPAHLTVAVRDDGVGFDASTIGSSISRRGGYGLFSIRERLAYIGGMLEIRSRPGHGSEFSLTTPWEAKLDCAREQTHGNSDPSRR